MLTWNNVFDNEQLVRFLSVMGYFHDSCIKELKYISGAYVTEKLAMHPINDQRVLTLVIQRQNKNNSMIEMKFEELTYLKLVPNDEKYTCEILDSTMIWRNGNFYWCDCGGLSETELESYSGTIICAKKFSWRAIDGCLGNSDFYYSVC